MLSITINITGRTIMGALFVGAAVAISSLTIVRAEHVSPDTKVYKCNTGTACLTGDSSAEHTLGIHAMGLGTALQGETSTTASGSGVAGISTATTGNGHGVYGKSSNGEGIYGTSTTASGVYGTTSATGTDEAPIAGVYGTSKTSWGVYGTSNATHEGGIFGMATGGGMGIVGLTGSAASYPAVLAVAQNSASWIFQASNSANFATCIMDQDADLSCTGKISGGSPMLTRQRSEAGRRVLTYSSQSATPTIEDLGAAQMRDGIANVELPHDLASVIDLGNPYYVFLTPMGDTRGLYVGMENARGFQVRENMHGRSNVTFQYRIIAVPLGAKNSRLPTAPDMKVRLPELPSPVH